MMKALLVFAIGAFFFAEIPKASAEEFRTINSEDNGTENKIDLIDISLSSALPHRGDYIVIAGGGELNITVGVRKNAGNISDFMLIFRVDENYELVEAHNYNILECSLPVPAKINDMTIHEDGDVSYSVVQKEEDESSLTNMWTNPPSDEDYVLNCTLTLIPKLLIKTFITSPMESSQDIRVDATAACIKEGQTAFSKCSETTSIFATIVEPELTCSEPANGFVSTPVTNNAHGLGSAMKNTCEDDKEIVHMEGKPIGYFYTMCSKDYTTGKLDWIPIDLSAFSCRKYEGDPIHVTGSNCKDSCLELEPDSYPLFGNIEASDFVEIISSDGTTKHELVCVDNKWQQFTAYNKSCTYN